PTASVPMTRSRPSTTTEPSAVDSTASSAPELTRTSREFMAALQLHEHTYEFTWLSASSLRQSSPQIPAESSVQPEFVVWSRNEKTTAAMRQQIRRIMSDLLSSRVA